jgi:putative aldouronate transport system substrate-binding protein
VPIEWVTPPLVFTPEQEDALTEISTDLLTYVNDAYANWIIEGGIEEDWEEYKTKIYDYGLQEYLDIYQEAYNSFSGN